MTTYGEYGYFCFEGIKLCTLNTCSKIQKHILSQNLERKTLCFPLVVLQYNQFFLGFTRISPAPSILGSGVTLKWEAELVLRGKWSFLPIRAVFVLVPYLKHKSEGVIFRFGVHEFIGSVRGAQCLLHVNPKLL